MLNSLRYSLEWLKIVNSPFKFPKIRFYFGKIRVGTRQQNAMNQETQRVVKTSKYKGVTWDKGRNKWQSSIKKDGKSIYIGRYVSEEEAGRAYNKKAIELFGEFAKLNIL